MHWQLFRGFSIPSNVLGTRGYNLSGGGRKNQDLTLEDEKVYPVVSKSLHRREEGRRSRERREEEREREMREKYKLKADGLRV